MYVLLLAYFYLYRDETCSLQILLSRTQAGPGRTVKQEQEEISPNHIQRLNLISVLHFFLPLRESGIVCYQNSFKNHCGKCQHRQRSAGSGLEEFCEALAAAGADAPHSLIVDGGDGAEPSVLQVITFTNNAFGLPQLDLLQGVPFD